ncbi:uncharacterized protein [Dysidea avara]|uniref:uncharacterized protein n=1 Tax=Dysidea avara TaxID=196820 RepID=UPI00333404EC
MKLVLFVVLWSLLTIIHHANCQGSSSVKMDYYFGFFNNLNWPEISIIIISFDSQAVNYSVEAPGVGYYANGTVLNDREVIVNFPYTLITSSHNDQNKGIHLMIGSDKVTVIGQNFRHHSTDTFLCLPIKSLSVDEYVYYGISVPRPNILQGSGTILVVGTENNTIMRLTVTQPVTVSISESTVNITVNIQYSFVIKRFQTVLIKSLDDLTGTKIVTDKPVSVLSGHECGRVPNNVASCEHLIEQVPPTTLWGRAYYVAPLATRMSYTIKIVAAFNFTIIDFYCNNQRETYIIDDGKSFNKTLSLQEHCAIYSSKEILVVQFSHGQLDDDITGDPIMTLVPATNYYNNKFHFSTFQDPSPHNYRFVNFINIIVLAQYYQPDMIYLISGGVNRSLDTQQWVPIMVNNVTEAYGVQVNITEGVAELAHHNTIASMYLLVYGWGHHHSYGHPGGYSMFGPSTGSSSVKMDYYFGFFNNLNWPEISIIIISFDSQAVNYSVEAPGVGYYANGTVLNDREVIVNFPYTLITSSHNDQNKGIHLMIGSDKVTVIGQNFRHHSTDTFLCLPIKSLSVDEYVYYGISVPRPNILQGSGTILVVGTENNTIMRLTVTQPVTVSISESTVNITVNIQYSFVIKRFQTVLIKSLDDLTGTKIVTDKPVSVLSGHECGRVPNNVASCEHLIEQVPPTTLWGRAYYVAPLATRMSYTIKIVAAFNFTIIDFYCNNQRETYIIDDGKSFNKTLSLQEHCAIYSSKEILVVQFSHGQLDDDITGDPIMTLVPATNYYNNKFHFSTFQDPSPHNYRFVNFINIIVLAQYYQPDMIYLISGGVNRSLETQQWVPIMVNNVTEAYGVQVNITEGVAELAHHNTIASMYLLVYGWGHHHSYGHPGGYSMFGPSTGSSSVKMDYYFGFFNNLNWPEISIIIISFDSQAVNYSVEAPGVGYYANGTVLNDREVIVNFPYTLITSSHNDQNKGIHLMIGSDKVTVIGQNFRHHSTDTFLCLPIKSLSVDEYVYYGISVPRPNILQGSGTILVVGTENNTIMRLTVTQPVTVSISESTVNITVNIQYSFVIKRFQTVLIKSLDDLTGTKIVTDKPVSVLSGHECGRVPNNVASCEHLIEQVPPTTLWGRAYYVAPLATRMSYTIKIVAAFNFTIIDFYCNNQRETYIIDDGKSFNKTLSLQEHCAIYSSKEILVVQFSHGQLDDDITGDPIMTLVPATNYYNNKFHFSTFQDPSPHNYRFVNFINIIVLAQYYQPDMIYLISGGVNRSLDTQQWVPIMVNNVTEAYGVQVNITEGVAELAHHNTIASMYLLVYGWGHHHSYGHPGGYSMFGPSTDLCIFLTMKFCGLCYYIFVQHLSTVQTSLL